MIKNKVVTAIDKSKSYRVHITDMTDIIEEERKLHLTTPLATAVVGRLLMGCALMSLDLKDESNSLSLILQGDGVAREVVATAHGDGSVKGYIAKPDIELDLNEKGKLDVGLAVGEGKLFVTKDLGLKEPYVGSIELVSGEIAEDITTYFLKSEQKATSVALGVKIDLDKRVKSAGGMLIEVLPDAQDEAIDALEELIGKIKPITTYVDEAIEKIENKDERASFILNLIFGNIDQRFKPEILEVRDLQLSCDCSRQKIEKALITIGRQELESILNEDEKAELVCHFCNKKYFFDREDLENIVKNI